MPHTTGNGTHSSASILERLLDRFNRSGRAINVNFRQLVSWAPLGERATHYLHPYPAKLLPQIPIFFLSNNLLSSPGDTVLDPFCGSGTVLLEGILHNRNGIESHAWFGIRQTSLRPYVGLWETFPLCTRQHRAVWKS